MEVETGRLALYQGTDSSVPQQIGNPSGNQACLRAPAARFWYHERIPRAEVDRVETRTIALPFDARACPLHVQLAGDVE
ncbi:MAG: hypothetical protein WCB12_05690 [Bryobacteraceae bacterium]